MSHNLLPIIEKKNIHQANADACGLVIGIDASRNRSGGAIAHLRGLLSACDPKEYGIRYVHVWAYDSLLDQLPVCDWIIKHYVPVLSKSVFHQLWWQYKTLPKLCVAVGCDILFNTDAGSVAPFQPAVSLSQDMLSFEPGEMQRYSFPSRSRFRLEILKHVQLRCLKRSKLSIFLTEHAQKIIGGYVDLGRTIIIPHGIDSAFYAISRNRRPWPVIGVIRCLYVSNAAPYKHQWHVVEAVARLRETSTHDIRLRLVGGGSGPSLERMLKAVDVFDPHRKFVELVDFVSHDSIPNELAAADLFAFASSCENLPITLLEAMASGIAICSSDRGPMPEVLGPNAAYFDPEDPSSISDSLRTTIEDHVLRESIRSSSLLRSATFTWEACAEKTWRALATVAAG